MGEPSIRSELDGSGRREFVRHLLNDLRALEWMIEHDLAANASSSISSIKRETNLLSLVSDNAK